MGSDSRVRMPLATSCSIGAVFGILMVCFTSLAAGEVTGDVADCKGEPYTAPNGLRYFTNCAGAVGNTDDSATDFASTDTETFDDCMAWASTYQPLLSAVVFKDGTCKGYTEDLFPLNITGSTAVANPFQITLSDDSEDTKCPYDSYTAVTTDSTEEEFEILCNQDFGTTYDYCPYNLDPQNCRPHASTMMECLVLCSQARPLCKAVSWNPDMNAGYGNCYLKSDTNDPQRSDSQITHSARVTSKVFSELDTECPDSDTYEKDDTTYAVSCNTGRVGSENMTSVHSDSLDSCLVQCSSSVGEGCLGILFDMGMDQGYQNCYLLNATGSALTGGTNMTYAEVTASKSAASSNSNQSSPNGQKSGGGSQAWIAGPVVGVLAVIIVALAGWIWWRRRQRNGRTQAAMQGWQHEPQGPKQGWYADSGVPPAQAPGYSTRAPTEKHGEPTVRHEMQDPNSERLWPPQLQA